MMMFDPMYLLFMAPALILAVIAQILTKSTFNKYSKVPSGRGLTGAQAARMMLQQNGVTDVEIEAHEGFLTDHYDPRTKKLRLSEAVYASNSLSAVGVACHEAGHALQDAHGYKLLGLRTVMVPATNFGSTFSYLFIMVGFLLSAPKMIAVGAILFTLVVLFAIVTLPVEWDASHRAKLAMVSSGLVTADEAKGASAVLNAAFLTYVASAVSALLTLLYYLMRAGLLGGRSRD